MKHLAPDKMREIVVRAYEETAKEYGCVTSTGQRIRSFFELPVLHQKRIVETVQKAFELAEEEA